MANLARHNEAQLLPTAPAPPAIDTQEVQRLWSAILRHRRLFITVWIAFVVLVGVLTFLWPKSYTTTVRLMAGSPNDSLNNGGANSTDLPILNALVLQSGEQSAETFAQIAEQENVSSQVVKKTESRHNAPGTSAKRDRQARREHRDDESERYLEKSGRFRPDRQRVRERIHRATAADRSIAGNCRNRLSVGSIAPGRAGDERRAGGACELPSRQRVHRCRCAHARRRGAGYRPGEQDERCFAR